ncbi:hypothetical protein EC968_009947 [Mortierella alpina]|nr:hypothetical protein EC968_009947 [Mortierella alpina]
MHGLAESKWSKQRSGPQFFSTKVDSPTAPAETVFESAPASAQVSFSSSRSTLQEAEEGRPSPKLPAPAGPPGAHPHPHPVSNPDQSAANAAPTRVATTRPVQESTAAPRRPPSPSGAPRAPAKANGGNPWAAFALAADPEGQAQDGRSYVGGRSYIVDKPAATSAARNHPSKPLPPPQSKPQKPQVNSPKPASQPQSNTNQRPGLTLAGSGRNSSASTPASQQSWSQLPRSATRPPVDNRWAGKPLATTAMFSDDFFSTAKPRTQASNTASLSSPSRSSNGWSDQSNTGNKSNNFTPKQEFSTDGPTRPGFSTGSQPGLATAPKSWGDYKQQQDPRQQRNEPQQYQDQQQQELEHEQAQEQRQPSQRQPPPPQSYQQQVRSGPINGLKQEPSKAWPDEDGGSIGFHPSSAVNNESGRTSRMDAVSDIPDDPLFLQYPIGDGCHVVVAMYVERTAEAAASRFPTMTRKRQESSWKQKSVEEVTTIFKQALIEEKKDVTG